MVLYDSNKQEVVISDKDCKKIVGHGYFGSVYRYGKSDCLKLCDRRDNMLDDQYLSLEVYTILAYLKSDYIVDIKEVYFKDLNSYSKVYGYLMPFYQKSSKRVLDMPKEYLINNLVELLTVAKRCSELGVLLDDLKIGNTICAKDRMILIDPDFWSFDVKCGEGELTYINLCKIRELVFKIVYREIKYSKSLCKSGINPFDIAYELFPIRCETMRVPEVMTNVLDGFSSINDYVLERVKSKK